jgi:hypothetical protein
MVPRHLGFGGRRRWRVRRRCALEVDDDGVPEVLGGGGRADGERLNEAKRMACSGTPIASCCEVKARLERLRAEMASVVRRGA